MSSPNHRSLYRVIIGGVALLIALTLFIFVLPDANRRLEQERKARITAKANLDNQLKELKEFQELATQIAQGRERLEALEQNIPKGSIGEMQWLLSRTLHDLTQKHGVRLLTVKYGLPNREGAKGTDLEAMDVEFNATGVFEVLKPFMRALEGSDLPFAVSSVRLEESPEGGRLTVTLRAFRRSGATKDDAREDA